MRYVPASAGKCVAVPARSVTVPTSLIVTSPASPVTIASIASPVHVYSPPVCLPVSCGRTFFSNRRSGFRWN